MHRGRIEKESAAVGIIKRLSLRTVHPIGIFVVVGEEPRQTRICLMVNFLLATAVMFRDAMIMFGLAVADIP
jgi:hypothetical protein